MQWPGHSPKTLTVICLGEISYNFLIYRLFRLDLVIFCIVRIFMGWIHPWPPNCTNPNCHKMALCHNPTKALHFIEVIQFSHFYAWHHLLGSLFIIISPSHYRYSTCYFLGVIHNYDVWRFGEYFQCTRITLVLLPNRHTQLGTDEMQKHPTKTCNVTN